jgi:membrane fusion protein, multidrug efflux system
MHLYTTPSLQKLITRKQSENYKLFFMKITVQQAGIIASLFLITACGSSNKENKASLNDKKTELQKLKDQQKKLEQEIAKLDTGATANKAKLVAVQAVVPQDFSHYIDLQGIVDAENISYVTPRGAPGQVKALYVKQGDYIRKGQLLMKLDDAITRQSVVAAKQSQEAIKTQMALAKTVYERQKALFEKGIGSEIQLLQSKSNYEGLENSLKAAVENARIAEEQLRTAHVYAEVSGVADEVTIRVGETFTGSPMMGIKIVNTSSLKVTANIPENYLTRIRKGTNTVIEIPDLNKKVNSSVSVVSQSINANTRSFVAECKIGYDKNLKPNQAALVKFLDYTAKNALVIPVNVVQSDEKGKYVFVMEAGGNGKNYARRKTVVVGELYGDAIEIKPGGLNNGDQLITQGYQNLYDGQLISAQ